MNWFTKISKFMNFTPELNSILDKIIEQFTENGALIQRTTTSPIYQFTNPYSNQHEYLVVWKDDLGSDTTLGRYSGSTPYQNSDYQIQNAKPDDLVHSISINSEPIGNQHENALRETLYHEMIHMIDPKTNQKIRRAPVDPQEDQIGYFQSPVEFDAFSNQIANVIASSIKEGEIEPEEILQWIQSPGLRSLPLSFQFNPPAYLVRFIKAIESDESLVRRFKMSLYHLVQNLGMWDRPSTTVTDFEFAEKY